MEWMVILVIRSDWNREWREEIRLTGTENISIIGLVQMKSSVNESKNCRAKRWGVSASRILATGTSSRNIWTAWLKMREK